MKYIPKNYITVKLHVQLNIYIYFKPKKKTFNVTTPLGVESNIGIGGKKVERVKSSLNGLYME